MDNPTSSTSVKSQLPTVVQGGPARFEKEVKGSIWNDGVILFLSRSTLKPNLHPCSPVEIRGSQGRDLTLPCYAPSYLNNPLLHWTFSSGKDPSHILTYDSQSGRSNVSAHWGSHVELDGFRVPFGDGSLRLMDPGQTEHTGSYTCVFSMLYNTHTERNEVTIENPVGEVTTTRTLIEQATCSSLNWFTVAQELVSYQLDLSRSILPGVVARKTPFSVLDL